MKNKDSWYYNNIEHSKAYQKQYRIENPEKFTAKSAKRRAILKDATSDLSGQEITDIENLYKYADMLTKFSGVAHHVDHIIPLIQGGLHEIKNLQVTTATYNEKKKGSSKVFDIDEDCLYFRSLNDCKVMRNVTSSKSKCKPVICYETGKEYFSVTECAKDFGTSSKLISAIVNERKSSFQGYHFYLKENSYKLNDLIKQWKYQRRNTIKCIETNEIFYTYKDAAETFGSTITKVSNSVKKGTKLQDKYTLVYIEVG